LLLLDTCVLLWLVGQQQSLSVKAKEVIAKNSNAIFISAISAFEIGVKYNKGLLSLPMPVEQWFTQALELHGIVSLSVDCEIALKATLLPDLHRDPADRIIVATALTHQLNILTPDQHIKTYPQVKTIW
jgi:PIN domain nuclease of toxin-antitoxin system